MTSKYTRVQYPPKTTGSRYGRVQPVHRQARQLRGTPAQINRCVQSRNAAAIFNELWPQETEDRRSTYNLPVDDLHRLANDLINLGWQIWEVVERLQIDPPETA